MAESERPGPTPEGSAGEDDLAVVRRRLAESWRGLTDALSGLPEARLDEAGAVGNWSVKDVMGHIAFWDGQALLAAERHLAGQPPAEVADWEEMNARQAALRADRSAAEQRAEMERAHGAIVALLASRPPLDPAAVGLCGCLEEDTDQHYDEHARDILAWRVRVGL